jgi:hypothetical protein
MIFKYALIGIGIAVFSVVFSILTIRENRRIERRKKELRDFPKLFDFDNEEKKK